MGSEWSIIRNVEGDNRDSIRLEWKTSQWDATILTSHEQFMHARMQNAGGYTFDLTIVYGEGRAMKRQPLWSGIDAIRPTSSKNDWLMIRDFNEIRHPSERQGHGNYDRTGANEFENAINGFTELEAIGGKFT